MSSKSKHEALLDDLYRTVNQHLVALFSDMLTAVPDQLNQVAAVSTDAAEKEKAFMLLHFLDNHSEQLNQSFFITLNEQFKRRSKDGLVAADELSLVSEDEMEELVAITTMHARAMNQFGEQVDHLEARLEYLEISTDFDITRDCMNPDKVGEIFQSTLRPYSLELAHRISFYSLFEQHVILRLQPMYTELNTQMIRAGVMPEILLKTNRGAEQEKPEIATRVTRSADTAADPVPGIHRNFQNASSGQSLDDIGRYLHGDYIAPDSAIQLPSSFRRPVSKQESDGKQYYARDDVLVALSRLQGYMHASSNDADSNDIEQIKRSLYTEMARQEGGIASKRVKTLDERSIDFVGLMFNAITEDPSIAIAIKGLLLRLQIPVIKVAMSDERLFRHSKHPARQVLDMITETGKGVNDERDQLYTDLEKIVDDILEHYDIDIECFNKAAAQLHALMERESRKTRQTEQKQQRQIVYTNAREVVVDEVRHITAKKCVPQNVMPLITNNWPSLMINRYVKHGKESWEWLESVMLMKLMIKCLQPINDSKQWQTVWNNHLALVEAVEDELQHTKQDMKTIADQINKLKDAFLELLDAYGFRLVQEARATSTDLQAEQDAEREAEIAASRLRAANEDIHDDDEELRSTHIDDVAVLAREKLNKLPSNVHPGVWFEIYNGDDRAVRRLKLSVVLTEVAKLVFVDRKGVKVIEKDAEEFARELDAEKSRFIADHSTFDHALGQVINALAA